MNVNSEYKKLNIKIFVSHRIDINAEIINSPLYINVNSGAVFNTHKNDIMYNDNTGDNISEKNKSYCELTVQYWAWKNIEADYYGLCHYRRYISLSPNKYDTDNYATVIENYISAKTIEKYSLDNTDYLNKLLKEYDIIVTEPSDYTSLGMNIRQQYAETKYLHIEHIDLMLEIIKENYPSYYNYAKEYIYGYKLIPCNMFIMSKNIFNEYNEFLFGVLAEVEKKIDTSNLSIEGLRLFGHLGERLLGIFINYKQETCKIIYLQRILFLKPEKPVELKPISDNSINIVFSSSNYYAPYLYTTIYSLIQYKDNHNIYDIIILTTDISKQNILKLKEFEKNKNIYINVYDVGYLVKDYNFKGNNHITIETFYRLFIPIIFKKYNYIIYLDSDIIIKRNIADIIKECNFNYTINATRDVENITQYYFMENIYKNTKEILKLENPEQYFQAGVFVFNISLFNKKYSVIKLLEYATSQDFIYLDQDILNAFLKDDINYIDIKWNYMYDCYYRRINNVRLYAPRKIYELYTEARKNPYIIHYAGEEKPWNNPNCDLAEEFWKNAKNTPFHEIILHRMMHESSKQEVYNESKSTIRQVIFETIDHYSKIMYPFRWIKKVHHIGYIRQIADKIFPHGTIRRKIVKKMLFR